MHRPKYRRTAAPATPPVVEYRSLLHRDLASLEAQMTGMATLAERSLELAHEALKGNDVALCEAVIAGDDDLDRLYHEIQERAVELIGRQRPVASDLRLLISLIHTVLHLERIGDMAVNVAEAARSASALPSSGEILEQLASMGERAVAMTGLAVDAFVRRDGTRCEQLAALDDEIDQLNREMANQIVACRGDEARLEWATRMLQVSRYLERAADHAVDIGEQAWFLITGEVRELD
jgi:phosphate transport system protein